MNKIKRIIYVIVGLVSLILGVIGVVLPVLPTTPFLLLTSFCFLSGSKRAYNWFISTKIYKKYLENFAKNRAMTLKQKISILLFADTIIILTMIFIDNIYGRISLFLVILAKLYYFIFKIKTIKVTVENRNK